MPLQLEQVVISCVTIPGPRDRSPTVVPEKCKHRRWLQDTSQEAEINTFPMTHSALLWLRLLLAARAFAVAAHDAFGNSKFRRLSSVELFQRHFIFLLFVDALPWRAAPWAIRKIPIIHAKHELYDVVEISLRRPTCSAAGIEGRHAVGIVEVPLLVIV